MSEPKRIAVEDPDDGDKNNDDRLDDSLEALEKELDERKKRRDETSHN